MHIMRIKQRYKLASEYCVAALGRTMIQRQASTRTPFSGSSASRRAAACAALLTAGAGALDGVLCLVRELPVAVQSGAASPMALHWRSSIAGVCMPICGGKLAADLAVKHSKQCIKSGYGRWNDIHAQVRRGTTVMVKDVFDLYHHMHLYVHADLIGHWGPPG